MCVTVDDAMIFATAFGTPTALVTVERAQRPSGALPQAELVLLPGAGHVPTLTRPEEIAGAISSFFNIGRAWP
jgi:pimeloyl-ACP methyl ester carboxylesterase